jgi:hypothetical protein
VHAKIKFLNEFLYFDSLILFSCTGFLYTLIGLKQKAFCLWDLWSILLEYKTDYTEKAIEKILLLTSSHDDLHYYISYKVENQTSVV